MKPSSEEREPAFVPWDRALAEIVYRWRFVSALSVALLVGAVFAGGASRIASFTRIVGGLGETSTGAASSPPLIFDPSLDVWFVGLEERAVDTYYEIEDRFIAEDFILVSFEARDGELGVFSRDSLATISRLTERFLTIPGVRHVRSLTGNPWIRWGTVSDGEAREEGLIISDLVEGDPTSLTEREILERMVAVLGAEAAARRVGEARVRSAIGEGASFSDHIGEPRLLGTIVDPEGTTTALQIQVLRPRVDLEALSETIGSDRLAKSAATIHATSAQRAALRGVEHFLRLERGLAVPTPGYAELERWADSHPDPEERRRRRLELENPSKNFMSGPSGQPARKFFEFDALPGGGFVDRSDPTSLVDAPDDFRPRPAVPYEFHLGGVPLFERNFEEVGMGDAKFLPLMFGMIFLGLLLTFRSAVGVVAPLVVVAASILATVGLTFAMGDLLNNMTMMTPNLLTAVGIADAIHLVASWATARAGHRDKRTLIVEVIRKNALPVLLTSLTTAVGFYTLMVSSVQPIYMLGYTAGFGTIAAYLVSMTVVPALLSLVPHRPGAAGARTKSLGLFGKDASDRMAGFVVRRRTTIVAAGGIIVAGAIVGVANVELDSDHRKFFPADNPTMSDYHWIEARLGGVGDLELVFTGVAADAEGVELPLEERPRLEELRLRSVGLVAGLAPLDDGERAELLALEARERAVGTARIGITPAFLQQLDAFEARLRREMKDSASPLSVLTDFISPLDVLRKIHQVQNGNDARFYRVPGDEAVSAAASGPTVYFDELLGEWSYIPPQNGSTLVAQYYLQHENGARPGETLATQLSADRTRFRMQGRVGQASTETQMAAFRRIEEIATEEFPLLAAADGAGNREALSELTVSGKSFMFALTANLVASEFLQSMTIALAAITALIGLIFRSLRLALVAILPNVLPIVVPLSAFGLLGIPLTAPAVFVSSIALGVCVDDTIHFLANYDRAIKEGRTNREAIAGVFREIGLPLVVTTLVLIIGFGTMLLGDFVPNVLLGALATIMIALALAADLLLTPAVLSLFGERSVHDPSRLALRSAENASLAS